MFFSLVPPRHRERDQTYLHGVSRRGTRTTVNDDVSSRSRYPQTRYGKYEIRDTRTVPLRNLRVAVIQRSFNPRRKRYASGYVMRFAMYSARHATVIRNVECVRARARARRNSDEARRIRARPRENSRRCGAIFDPKISGLPRARARRYSAQRYSIQCAIALHKYRNASVISFPARSYRSADGESDRFPVRGYKIFIVRVTYEFYCGRCCGPRRRFDASAAVTLRFAKLSYGRNDRDGISLYRRDDQRARARAREEIDSGCRR